MNEDKSTKKLTLILFALATLCLIVALSPGWDWTDQINWRQWEFRWPLVQQESSSSSSSSVTQRVVEEESAVIEVVESASPSVVSVLEKQVTYDLYRGPVLEEASIGTGFVAGENLIVTNRHVVISTVAGYTIVDNDGNRYPVTSIYRDSLNDLAILQIEDGDFKALELGDSDALKVGQTVVAIGNALGRFYNTVTKGVVSGIGRGITASSGLGQYQRLEDVIQTDAALNPGNSGGPLLNLAGQVIGVNVATGQGTENIGFAIPANSVAELLEEFKSGTRVSRPFLGVEYLFVSEELAEERELASGAYIRSVVADSAAEEAGVKESDIITHVNGTKIDKTNTLGKLILKHKVGDKITLKIWRNSKILTPSVTLGAAPVEE
ncbi:trypsin-like peptidase domain-containing protein [Patescibacteria group bacterium]|nr:trypsin-like peptidase domain-containing protein [Patescibacteria group bacterium]